MIIPFPGFVSKQDIVSHSIHSINSLSVSMLGYQCLYIPRTEMGYILVKSIKSDDTAVRKPSGLEKRII